MKLVAYRSFRPLEEQTPKMRELYGRLGIKESFLRDIDYSGPHEVAWAFLAKRIVGQRFSTKLRIALANAGIEAVVEERAKTFKRIVNKLTRNNRSTGLEPSIRMNRFLETLLLPQLTHALGSVKDLYGIRVILPNEPGSRDRCYEVLDVVLRLVGITNESQLLGVSDYLSFRQNRFSSDGKYLGRYESLQVSFMHLGVPVEVQIRDADMDLNAKTTVKRNGLD
jgi:hypothetical protein